jgi:hypothetical protein
MLLSRYGQMVPLRGGWGKSWREMTGDGRR